MPAEEGERRGGAGADLPHPVLHPVPDNHARAAGEHPVQGVGLHGGHGDVPQRHGQQSDADPQPLGRELGPEHNAE